MKPLEGPTHIGDSQTLHALGRIGRWGSTTYRRKDVPAKMPSSDAAPDFPAQKPSPLLVRRKICIPSPWNKYQPRNSPRPFHCPCSYLFKSTMSEPIELN